MPDLREQLENVLRGRVAFLGVGNVDYGDDGLGVHLAQELLDRGVPDVILAGNVPERFVGQVAEEHFDSVIFLDAVEFGASPGSVVLLDSSQMAARFPQISTHKISLALLSSWLESNGKTRAWLLGVQPESLCGSNSLSQCMKTTLDALSNLVCGIVSTARLGLPRTEGVEEAQV